MMMALTEATNGIPLKMLLQDLADGTSWSQIRVNGLSMDSRDTKPGALFLACHGTRTSGINFINAAIEAGAVAIAAEADAGLEDLINDTPVIAVSELRHKAGIIASRYYDHPTEKMNVVGVTGTNGKTSVAYFISQALAAGTQRKAGLIGTLGYGVYPQLRPGLNTTPDPITVQKTLAEFYQQGADTAVMEVTSIGLEQGRVRGVDFNIGIFTNLTIDHLDYHGNMQAYADAKRQLFSSHGIRHAVINIDDEYGRKLCGEIRDNVAVVGIGIVAELPGPDKDIFNTNVLAAVEESNQGMTLRIESPWGCGELSVAISGRYNAYNLLACLATLCLLDMPFDQALDNMSTLTPVPGRLEKFAGDDRPSIYVDYAHTPDALRNVLIYLRSIKKGKLWCVFGCGGNRDRSKRPEMGAIAESYADEIIITSDNPRDEDPLAIIEEILTGLSDRGSVRIEADRNKAISSAVLSAVPGDIVLIAGKGHETYQEISGHRYPFSDRQLVRNLIGAGP